MNRYFQTQKKEDCCGCSACAQVCPVKCITLRLDKEGFSYPIIEEKACINCGKCADVCPMEPDNIVGEEPTAIYAGVIRKDDILMKSSSGGAFSAVAEYVLDNNGFVCGCMLDEKNQVNHTIIKNRSKLGQLRGSKYVQSDIQNIYSEVKCILERGDMVLFVGTPCQVAGLKLFIGKPAKGLITIDLICHGVPSQMFLDEWINCEQKKRKTKISNLNFRDKEKYGWSNVISFRTETGEKIIQPPSINSYYYAYLNALNYRETCYTCPFTTVKRTGDLTIADFWGVEDENLLLNERKGVSMILVNTYGGGKVLEKIEKDMDLYSCDLTNIAQRQTQLRKPVSRPSCRDDIYMLMQKKSYREVEKKYLRTKLYLYYLLASKMPKWLRNFIKG